MAAGACNRRGGSGILLENNSCIAARARAFHQHLRSATTWWRNNLFAFNVEHSACAPRAEPHRSFWLPTMWSSRLRHSARQRLERYDQQFPERRQPLVRTRNGTDAAKLVFRRGQPWSRGRRAAGMRPRAWRPWLIDPKRPELGLCDRFPAYVLGFKPIDMKTVG